jgi:hypothetical protein
MYVEFNCQAFCDYLMLIKDCHVRKVREHGEKASK